MISDKLIMHTVFFFSPINSSLEMHDFLKIHCFEKETE